MQTNWATATTEVSRCSIIKRIHIILLYVLIELSNNLIWDGEYESILYICEYYLATKLCVVLRGKLFLQFPRLSYRFWAFLEMKRQCIKWTAIIQTAYAVWYVTVSISWKLWHELFHFSSKWILLPEVYFIAIFNILQIWLKFLKLNTVVLDLFSNKER